MKAGATMARLNASPLVMVGRYHGGGGGGSLGGYGLRGGGGDGGGGGDCGGDGGMHGARPLSLTASIASHPSTAVVIQTTEVGS